MPITFRKPSTATETTAAADIKQRVADAVDRGDYDEAARICLESHDPAGIAVAASALFAPQEN